MKPRHSDGENREKDPGTVPPSTPQGPQSNDLLVAPAYRNGPYPGDVPEERTGEGSPVPPRQKTVPKKEREAEKEITPEHGQNPLLPKSGQDPGKQHGRDQHEP